MSRRAVGARSERGESLVELLVAVVLLGVAVVAVVSALGTSVVMSDVHRKQSTAGAEVRTFAERVETAVAGGAYTVCAGSGTYGGAYTAPGGFTAAVTAVRYWTGSAWSSSCSAATDIGLQKLSLQVASTDGRAAEKVDVVIRKPCAVGQSCT